MKDLNRAKAIKIIYENILHNTPYPFAVEWAKALLSAVGVNSEEIKNRRK